MKTRVGLRIGLLFVIICLSSQVISLSSAAGVDLGGPESAAKSRYQPVVGTQGMVVSDDRIASEWGAEILRQGGNAMDAAFGTAIVEAVTRPHYASIGGGGFLIYCPPPTPSGPAQCQALDYREKAPARAHRDMYIKNGIANTALAQNGALASGIPGVPAGLLIALERFGSLPRQKLMQRAIQLAKKGYLFTGHSEAAAFERWNAMNPEAKRIFGCAKPGETPKAPCAPGARVFQPDLAKVLERISHLGARGFYEGPVARQIVRGIQAAGGILTLADLKSYSPEFRTPLYGQFKKMEIISMPPPSSGGAILLQLLEYASRAEQQGAFSQGYESAETLHALIHAMSLSFADRAEHFGDPDFVKIPLTSLLSPHYLDQQWKTFDPDHASLPSSGPSGTSGPSQAGEPSPHEPQHTTHLSVIGPKGDAVSLTTTVNDNFGSGFVPPGTGIVMNNEMDDFSAQPGTPNLFGLIGTEANSIAPRKRPLSSMTPTIIREKNGNVRVVIGAAGGPRIITSVFLSLLNWFKGMSILDAVFAPRVHHQWKPNSVMIEKGGFSSELQKSLEKKGYTLQEVPSLGKIHALERLSNGRTWGAPDPRGEGAAVAQ